MVLASLLFATMGVGVKIAARSFNITELVFYRGLVSVTFTALVLRAQGTPIRTPVPMMHAWRTLVGTLSLGAWFYAIAHLPLATAMTLNYMSSVWIAAFIVGGGLLYGNLPRQGPLLATVLAGFAGVVLTLRPTLDQNQLFAGVIGLLSGIGAALAYMQVTALGRLGEPAGRTVFYFALGALVSGAVGIAFMGFTPWHQVTWQAAAWLVPIGVLASGGQWCMTKAYSGGSTLVAANLQYSGIVFASVYSVLLFGDNIPFIGWLGIAVIVASGIAATGLRARAARHASARPLTGTPKESHMNHNLNYTTLISADQLKQFTASGQPFMVFDCSFDLMNPQAGVAMYRDAHIPGAVYAHLDTALSDKTKQPLGAAELPSSERPASGGRHPLPAREKFAAWLGSIGFANGMQAVVYDRQGANYCGRLWWMLKWVGHDNAAVLDGGLQAWQAASGATASGAEPAHSTSNFTLAPAKTALVTTKQVADNLGRPVQTVVDARGAPRFRGEVGPLDPVAGHIPGALNRPFTQNIGADGKFKPATVLKAEFELLLAGRDAATVVHHCGSGVSAVPNILAMEIAGLGRAALYAGSWSEWCSDASRPVAQG